MEAVKMLLIALPTPVAAILFVLGLFVVALMAARLGYGIYVAKVAYKWIEWAEENIIGEKMGAEKKAKVIEMLRGYTPDWLDWAINEKTLDWIVEIVFKFSKKKLADYMESKSKETATVARFGKAGEEINNRKE